jgi:superfamily II DNA or RNA helicase
MLGEQFANHQLTPELYDFQKELVSQTFSLWQRRVQSINLISPTGSGKTVTFANIAAKVLRNPEKKVFLAMHRAPLIDQTAEKLTPYGISPGFIQGKRQEDPDARCQIATVQSLPNREWWRHFQPNLVIFDEAHRTGFFEIALETRHKIFPNAAFLYVTATPWRLGSLQLGDLCDEAVIGPMPQELIRRQKLAKPVYFRLPTPNIDNVELDREGDFDLKQLQIACNTPENIQHAVEQWQKLVPNRLTFAFCTGREHARNLAEAFNQAGVPARCLLSGEDEEREPEELLTDFQKRKFFVLCTVDKASEGVDCPVAEVALLCRPTHSPSLFTQQIGRVLRIYPGKECAYILDQADNCRRHFYLEDLTPDDFNLTHCKLKSKLGQAPQKSCPNCGGMIHASLNTCPFCKFVFTPRRAQIISLQGGFEIEIPENDQEAFWRYRHNLKQAWRKKESPDTARREFENQFGFIPPMPWGKGACLGGGDQFYQYQSHLRAIAALDRHPQEWIEKWLRCEMK